MKILNLYAGVGGNRQLWGNDHDITAVEYNESVAACYQDRFPKDTVVVADAHQYLLDHYHEFDFIWASPPCQSHSGVRQIIAKSYYENLDKPNMSGNKPIFPNMKLWQEIIFLQHHFKGTYVVENVIPYYKPLIQPAFTIGSHHFWSNKFIFDSQLDKFRCHKGSIRELENHKGINLEKYKFIGIDKRQVLRNMVEPEIGLYIFEQLTKNSKHDSSNSDNNNLEKTA